jgi:hypothetical protein
MPQSALKLLISDSILTRIQTYLGFFSETRSCQFWKIFFRVWGVLKHSINLVGSSSPTNECFTRFSSTCLKLSKNHKFRSQFEMEIREIFENVWSGNPRFLFWGGWCADIRNQLCRLRLPNKRMFHEIHHRVPPKPSKRAIFVQTEQIFSKMQNITKSIFSQSFLGQSGPTLAI